MANLHQQIKAEGYDVLDMVAGSQAFVFKVKHTKYGYVRALRVYKVPIVSEKPEEEKTYTQFQNECKLLLRLGNGGHPNVIRIGEPKMVAGHPYYEMDYLQGRDLEEFLQQQKCLTPVIFEKLAIQLSSALAYCHYDIYKYSFDPNDDDSYLVKKDEKWEVKEGAENVLIKKYKVIHNDIHTKNIFVKSNSDFVLLDFGLAFEAKKGLRTSLRAMGVPEYQAPEILSSNSAERPISERSDIYSLGVLLFECLTGGLPFKEANRENAAEMDRLLKDHQNSPIPNIWEKRQKTLKKKGIDLSTKDYPEWFETVIQKCLAKAPQDRYQNGKELFDTILVLIEEHKKKEQQRLSEAIDNQLGKGFEEELLVKDVEIRKLQLRLENITELFKEHSEMFDNERSELLMTHDQNVKNIISDFTHKLLEANDEKVKANNEKHKVELENVLLKNTIKILEQSPKPPPEIIEKVIETLPEKAEKEIQKAKNKTTVAVTAGTIVVAFIGFLGWSLKPTQYYESPTVDSTAVAVDTTAAVDTTDSLYYPFTKEEAENKIKNYEDNIQGNTPPDPELKEMSEIITYYPELEERIYLMYYIEAKRLEDLGDTETAKQFFVVANKIKKP